MVKRIASGLLKTLITLGVVLVVTVAVMVGLARQIVADIHGLHDDVTALLSRETGLDIAFDTISGSWKGLAPRFRISGLNVRQAPSMPVAFSARHVDLEILLLKSLLNLQPRVRLSLAGVNLTLARQDGQLRVEGLKAVQSGSSSVSGGDLAALILAQPKLSVQDSHVSIDGEYPQQVQLNIHQLQVEQSQGLRYAAGSITLRGPSDLSFSLRARTRGNPLQEGQLSGDVYLDIANADWLPWIPQVKRQYKTLELTGLKGGAETWLEYDRGRLVDVTSRFMAEDFTLRSHNEVQPPDVRSLSGVLRWQRSSGDSWLLGLNHFRMITPRFTWQPSILSLSATHVGPAEVQYGVALDDADISPWMNYFLSLQPEGSKLYQTMKELHPAGKVKNFVLSLQRKDDKFGDYRFSTTIERFNCRAWEKYPGLRDLDVQLLGQRGLYLAKLNEDYLELSYPYLFRDTLVFNHIDGEVALVKNDDGLQLQSDVMHANTADLRSATQFSLLFPSDKSQPPLMQLQSTLRDVDASKKSMYLPAGIISPGLLKWLDEGILSGRLTRGDIVVNGPLGHDWIDDRRVLLGFSVADASLRFLPDWTEPVQHADADVIVDRGAVWARAVDGDYYQQAIDSALVEVPSVPQGEQHILRVQAQTRGRAENGFAVLQQTPLADQIGPSIQDMKVQGDMTVNLDLRVPLAKGPKTTAVDADVALRNGSFDLVSRKLNVADLNADVHFDLDNGLSASNLTGTTLGGAVTGSIVTTAAKQGGHLTQLRFNGTAQVAALQDWLKMSLLSPLSGKLDYGATIQLPSGNVASQTPATLTLTSNLKGTSVDLPEPYGKRADQTMDFRYSQTLNRDPARINLSYGQLLGLALQSGQGNLQKGMVSLGSAEATLPAQDIFSVRGSVGRFAPTEWEPVLDRIKGAANQYQEKFDLGHAAQLDKSSLLVGDLVLDKQSYGPVQVNLRRRAHDWAIELAGNNIVGSATLPFYVVDDPSTFTADSVPAVIELDHLRVPKQPAQADSGKPWQPVDLSPLRLPPADITINNLQLGDSSFGRWSVKLRRLDTGMRLKDVTVRMRAVDFFGQGLWSDVNGKRSVSISGDYRSDNIADVMRAWGSEPTMSSKKMNGSLSATWPGAPFEFSLNRVRGDINVKLEDGSFYNVKSGVVGKFWGALNFETLLRRLRLNFKDLRDKDMVYDKISANAHLEGGLLDVADVSLDSPAIKLQSKGTINLENTDLDMVMRVTVPVTRNLVLPAAAIGGVPAAAIAFVVEKALGDQFDKLTTIKYSVKGKFDEPKVEVMDSFNIIPKQVSETVLGNGSNGKSDSSGGEKSPAPTAPAAPSPSSTQEVKP